MKTQNEFQNLPKVYWKTLDKLIEGGWEPLINWLALEKRWHVNMSHHTAPVPVVAYHPSDRTVREVAPHHYRIHGYGETLAQAMDDAFSRVRSLITPK